MTTATRMINKGTEDVIALSREAGEAHDVTLDMCRMLMTYDWVSRIEADYRLRMNESSRKYAEEVRLAYVSFLEAWVDRARDVRERARKYSDYEMPICVDMRNRYLIAKSVLEPDGSFSERLDRAFG